MRTNHIKWKKNQPILEALFQAYLMLPSVVLTTQKMHQRKANSLSFALKPAKEV